MLVASAGWRSVPGTSGGWRSQPGVSRGLTFRTAMTVAAWTCAHRNLSLQTKGLTRVKIQGNTCKEQGQIKRKKFIKLQKDDEVNDLVSLSAS